MITGTHTTSFTKQGLFLFLLIGVAMSGCGEETVEPDEPPIASFTAGDSVFEGDSLSLENTSTNATTFAWSIVPGSMVSTERTPTFELTEEGIYSIRLIATGEGGSDTATREIRVERNDEYRLFGKEGKTWYLHAAIGNSFPIAEDPCAWDNTLKFTREGNRYSYSEESDICSSEILPNQTGVYQYIGGPIGVSFKLDPQNISFFTLNYTIDSLSHDYLRISTILSGSTFEFLYKTEPRKN